jgi:hypothetical protein
VEILLQRSLIRSKLALYLRKKDVLEYSCREFCGLMIPVINLHSMNPNDVFMPKPFFQYVLQCQIIK